MEGIFLWSSIFSYFLCFASFMIKAIFKKEYFSYIGFKLFYLGFISEILLISYRWILTEHPPVMGGYENSLTGSLSIGLLYIIGAKFYHKLKDIVILASPVMLIMLGFGVTSSMEHMPLSPPYQSNWLFVHVGFAWLAWGSFVIAACLGIVYLYRKNDNLGIIDDLILKFIIFGFISQGFMIVSGALWAYKLWGSYWSWDPVETWSLISLVVYGIIVHLRITMGWRGRRIAWLVIIAILSPIIYFFGVGFLPQLHTSLVR